MLLDANRPDLIAFGSEVRSGSLERGDKSYAWCTSERHPPTEVAEPVAIEGTRQYDQLPAPNTEADDLVSVGRAETEAWWTGPMLAASPATLPRGHVLVEPYVSDSIANGSHHLGSIIYALYGVTDRFSAGMIPSIGYSLTKNARNSSTVQFGDLTLVAEYKLFAARPRSARPAVALVFRQVLPSGRYDMFDERHADGIGAGIYAPSLAVYTQSRFATGGAHPVRVRLDVTHVFPAETRLSGRSVYGTSADFEGYASVGGATIVDGAIEYSLSKRWVIASDIVFRGDAATRLATAPAPATGEPTGERIRVIGGARSIAFAPALEYSWSSARGVLLGIRYTPPGLNPFPALTPVAAFNCVF